MGAVNANSCQVPTAASPMELFGILDKKLYDVQAELRMLRHLPQHHHTEHQKRMPAGNVHILEGET